jgi:nicotinamide riboside transporter PnuC
LRGLAETMPPPSRPAKEFPWWLAAAGAIAIVATISIAASDLYSQVFSIVAKGIGVTVFVTLVGYTLASALGLAIALLGLSGSIWLRQAARSWFSCSGSPSSARRPLSSCGTGFPIRCKPPG